MTTNAPSKQAADALVRRLWHYCNILRDDGLSYPDYVEQLTYLLFLKMSDEQGNANIPKRYAWASFATLDAKSMHAHYSVALSMFGKAGGMLGFIFGSAKNKIRDPGKLRLLVVDLIGQIDWSSLSFDLKGDAYEGLLEKNAKDTKSGAGQYFTPRPLIDAIVECINPKIGEAICDPACGTGGFLLSAHAYVRERSRDLSNRKAKFLLRRMIHGVELVPEVARLAMMNLFLHGISGPTDKKFPIECADSLKNQPTQRFEVVLTNPPFGIKGSITYSKGDSRPSPSADDLTVVRSDFWVQTANKQLNFIQHIATLLKPDGRAAVVVPDNVLFEGGLAAATIRRRLLTNFDVHTILRLPAGLFYAQSVKSNVLFFCKPGSVELKPDRELWIYNLRGNTRFSVKTNPLRREDLEDFVRLYQMRPRTAEASGPSPWKRHVVSEVLQTADCSLDLGEYDSGIPSHVPSLAKINELGELVATDLRRALDHLVRAINSSQDD